MNRPPPPGVLRHRGLEPFNPATLGSQVYISIFSSCFCVNIYEYYVAFLCEFLAFLFFVFSLSFLARLNKFFIDLLNNLT